MTLKNKKIVFLGDSITEGVGTRGREYAFPALIKTECVLKEAYNCGVGGSRIAPQHNSDDWQQNFLVRAENLPEADIYVVFGGTNDYEHGDAPLGNTADETKDTFCGACSLLFRGLIAKHPLSAVAVMTPIQRDDFYCIPQNACKGKHAEFLRTYVGAIIEIAHRYSLPVLNLFDEGGLCPQIAAQKKAFYADDVHLNEEGHRRLAEKVIAFLQGL